MLILHDSNAVFVYIPLHIKIYVLISEPLRSTSAIAFYDTFPLSPKRAVGCSPRGVILSKMREKQGTLTGDTHSTGLYSETRATAKFTVALVLFV